jgi:drug/metabolite transporter (DMT)-like permease
MALKPEAPSGVVRLGLGLGFALVYAACFTLIKAGLAFAPALAFAGLRVLGGGLLLLAFSLFTRRPLFPRREAWPGVLALATTATTLSYGAMFLSPGEAGAGLAAVLGNAQPLFLVVLGAVFLNERPTKPSLVALAFGLVGVGLIAYPLFTNSAVGGLRGGLLALIASGSSAVGSVIAKRMGPTAERPETLGWSLALGSAPLLAASAVFERGQSITWSTEFVALLAILALIGTAAASLIWFWLIQREAVSSLGMILFLVPVLGLALGTLAFNETLAQSEIVGAAVILGGLAVAGAGPERIRHPHQPDVPQGEADSSRA